MQPDLATAVHVWPSAPAIQPPKVARGNTGTAKEKAEQHGEPVLLRERPDSMGCDPTLQRQFMLFPDIGG